MEKYYDKIYADKDYGAECQHLKSLIPSDSQSLLDVACGTGKHLEILQDYFAVEGIDINPEMIEIAKSRTCANLHVGDMVNFNLDAQFDVIICLFGSIGYLKTVDNLNKAVANFSDHLESGGILLLEPFAFPNNVNEGLLTRDVGDIHITSNVSKEGNICVLDKTYHMPDCTIEKTYRLAMFNHDEYLKALTSAGFSAKIESYPSNFGAIYIGVKK